MHTKAQSRLLVLKRHKTTLWLSRFLLKVCINTYAACKMEYTNTCCERMHMRSTVCAGDPHTYDRLQDDKWEKMERTDPSVRPGDVYSSKAGANSTLHLPRPTQFLHEEEIATPRMYIHARMCIARSHQRNAINGTDRTASRTLHDEKGETARRTYARHARYSSVFCRKKHVARWLRLLPRCSFIFPSSMITRGE
ncbi:hypothetical protein HN011_011192 [Eciton burchellii]|nr:hypothetical protein HN011_011192 [Eciton burchellii]